MLASKNFLFSPKMVYPKDKENKSFTCLGNYKLHFQRKFRNAASDSTK